MHSFPSYVDLRTDDRFQYTSTMSNQIPHHYETWTPVDPALCNFQFETHPKQISHDYHYSQHQSPFYHAPVSQIPEGFGALRPLSGWYPPIGSYRNQRYDSPGGHLGGNMSESSSDYAVSPEVTRQRMTLSPMRYLSPTSETHFSQQSWTTDSSFTVMPVSTPTSTQTSSIAMKEIEFQMDQEQQLDLQEEDIRSQLPLNAPEELELSDSIATLTTSSRTSTQKSSRSSYDTDSSVSTPAQDDDDDDDDSDSDFDPRRKTLRQNQNVRQPSHRSPRRTSSSSYPTLDINNRIHKPTNTRATTNKEKHRPKSLPQLASSQTSVSSKAPKSFPCTFHLCGCTSTFANKNEWKRHVTSQHLQLGFYRCDLGACDPSNSSKPQAHQPRSLGQSNRGRGHNKRRSTSNVQSSGEGETARLKSYNDFNRKDLFTQHCRRMHGPARHLEDNTTRTNQIINARLRAQGRKLTASGSAKPMSTKDDDADFEEELESIRARCWIQQRFAPKRSSCGFCGKGFEASAHQGASHDPSGKAAERAWEERMEHLGKHYERDGFLPHMEGMDQGLLEWGLDEGILVPTEDAPAWLVGYEIIKPEEEPNGTGREGLRKRGPRRKISSTATVASVRKTEHDTSDFVEVKSSHSMKEEDSDEDALAEYE